MIPNLTLIVAAYVVVRLLMFILRQVPSVERRVAARVGVGVLCGLALVLVTLCALDTIGLGLSVGSSIDAKRGFEFPHSN